MENQDYLNFIGSVNSRESMIRCLDGYASERFEEIDLRKIKTPLTKSYLIEHTGENDQIKPITDIMQNQGIRTDPIDDNLYRVFDQYVQSYTGFLEVFSPRYFVVYSLQDSRLSDPRVNKLITNSPELDHVWLSGLTFNVLWNKIIQLNHSNRYVKISFLHASIYQVDNDSIQNEDEEESSLFDDADIEEIDDRRTSKFSITDRISVVNEKLNKLQEIYSPLYAINHLRFPSQSGRGGHDFYDNGKVTNRSGNFLDHRNHLIFVRRIYERLMELTESKAWYSIQKDTIASPGMFQKLVGAPVTIKFNEPLNDETFDYWIKSTFNRSRNRFRLWGNPIRLGPQKVHVYGIDRHLWQPIFLEITPNQLITILPRGTCGNTIHRLVTNIQRYIDPAAQVYIGDTNYQNLVEQSTQGVIYERKD